MHPTCEIRNKFQTNSAANAALRSTSCNSSTRQQGTSCYQWVMLQILSKQICSAGQIRPPRHVSGLANSASYLCVPVSGVMLCLLAALQVQLSISITQLKCPHLAMPCVDIPTACCTGWRKKMEHINQFNSNLAAQQPDRKYKEEGHLILARNLTTVDQYSKLLHQSTQWLCNELIIKYPITP